MSSAAAKGRQRSRLAEATPAALGRRRGRSRGRGPRAAEAAKAKALRRARAGGRALRKVQRCAAAVKAEADLLQLRQVVGQLAGNVRVPVLRQVPDGS